MRIFITAHVIITSITALGMFTNLCLVLLLLFADSLLTKLHFQLMKKARKKPGKGRTKYNLADGVTALALSLYVLYSDRARSLNQ